MDYESIITEKYAIRRLSEKKIEKLTDEEKREYFEELRKQFKNLKIDEERMNRQKRNYILAAKGIKSIIDNLFDPIIINKELIPNERGVLFVSNHLSSYDQFLIPSIIGSDRPVCFLAKSTLLELKRGKFYKEAGAVFLDENNIRSLIQAEDQITTLLLRGIDAYIYPEGSRNFEYPDKKMYKFHKGAARLSQLSGSLLVPLAITDRYKRGELVARVGKPMRVGVSDNINEATEYLEKDVILPMVLENEQMLPELSEKDLLKRLKKAEKINRQRAFMNAKRIAN